MNPRVTFVVPCYKLAHLLPECVNSILSQSYQDFEVLIMDDCSPDNTPEVARSFNDPRVQQIRNEPNLGHLRNYNKGISLARGEYIWLISADDRLRSTNALEQYVQLMDAHPGVGYIFCAGIGLDNGVETGLCKYSVVSEHETIFKGHDFLRKLLYANVVLASSGMVRRVCYEQHGAFPLDLPFAGDWYLWCLFALHFDVGYVAEPMVNYRDHHQLSMTTTLKKKDVGILMRDSLNVLWRMKREAEKHHQGTVAKFCEKAIAYEYARFLTGTNYIPYQMRLDECEQSIAHFSQFPGEANSILARVHLSTGDIRLGLKEQGEALRLYKLSLKHDSLLADAWLKYILLNMGGLGMWVRQRRRSVVEEKNTDLLAKMKLREAAK